MNAKNKPDLIRLLMAACTILLAAALAFQCITLYRLGAAGKNDPMFSRELVSGALSDIAWIFILWLIALTVSCIRGIIRPRNENMPSSPQKEIPVLKTPARINAARAIIILAAVGLAAAGIANGGMRDVLVKAINICTECIGLG